MKKVLILTLSSGEQDRPYVIKSIELQTYKHFHHLEISGLANREAHSRLYETIHARRKEYDYFLKLDADMIFHSAESLGEMVTEISAFDHCDHATWHVLDFLSETKLRGIHMFSPQARWSLPLPALFVDPDPTIPGRRIAFPASHHCHVLHAAFPSKRQAFQFGLHRGTKCFSRGDYRHSWAQRHFQLQLLSAVWTMFLRTKDNIRGMAMVGAEWARTQTSWNDNYRQDTAALAQFDSIKNLDADQIYQRCRTYWNSRRTVDRLCFWILYQTELKMRRPR